MGKWCLHASLFIFDRIIIKVAGNQDRHESSVKFDFGPNQATQFGVTCPWVTKDSHFRTWISLKLVNPDQILCVASLVWGKGCIRFWGRLIWHIGLRWAIVALLGYLFFNILKRQWWKFIKFCRHIDIDKMNVYNRKLRARGQFCWSYCPL